MSAGRAMPGLALPEYQVPETGPERQVPEMSPVPPAAVPAAADPYREPAPEPVPDVVPGLREPDPELVPVQATHEAGTGTGLVPVVAVPQARNNLAGYMLRSLCRWITQIAASQKRHHSFWAWLWAGFYKAKPESLEEHTAYIRSRQWLQDYMTGWVRTLCKWENVVFALTIGRALKVTGNNISRAGERQLRFWLVILGVFLAFLIRLAAH